jgi:molybdopterin converting factor small subunit
VTLTVRFFATFRDFLPQHANRSGLQMDVHEHTTVQALMKALRVPDNLTKIVLVNGQHASEDRFLMDGDIVTVFPPLIGGCSSNEG